MYTRRLLVFAMCAARVLGLLLAQDSPTPSVRVAGAVKQPLALTAEDLRKMPRPTVNTAYHGTETVFEGVRLHDVLKAAGVTSGSELRGKALSSYVIAEGEDGYQAVFSLAELDPSFVDSEVLLADTGGGKALSGAQGRFRLIAPKDKLGARSVRMLVKIEVVQLRK